MKKSCKDCLHFKACHEMTVANRAEEFNTLFANKCEDFANRSEWVHLPCKIGSRIFVIPTKENRLEEITEMKALGFSIGKPCNNANCFRVRGTAALFQPSFNDFSVSIFLTREEAEKALEGMK